MRSARSRGGQRAEQQPTLRRAATKARRAVAGASAEARGVRSARNGRPLVCGGPLTRRGGGEGGRERGVNVGERVTQKA